MFVNAIKNNLECVKAISTASKTPYKDELSFSMLSLLLINDEGWALTTKCVANNIIYADKIYNQYEDIRNELLENKIPPKKIFRKYRIKDNDTLILKNVFLNTLTKWSGLNIISHDYLDMVLIKFENPQDIMCTNYPTFAKSNASQGEILCRLGYPYSNFKVFKYDHLSKDIILDDMMDKGLQIMPMDGMLTRNIIDNNSKVSLFELSGNSFIGQLGGPVINKNGEVVGLMLGSAYKDSELDINATIKRNCSDIKVNNYNLVPFTICSNVDAIKDFLDKNKVKYNTK